MTALVVIPARWGSTRLRGKPLTMIAGRTLLDRVIEVGRRAVQGEDAELIVATDDDRVADHALGLGCAAVMTDSRITTGSGRALAAALTRRSPPALVCCLQGDAPFIPAEAVRAVLRRLMRGDCDCATPVVQLNWEMLDALRAHKRRSPSSGTTCLCAADGRALWFSKAVLPQMRDEDRLRQASRLSPVCQHLGLYGYTLDALRKVEAAEPSYLETLEGLEQLRALELGLTIQTIRIAGRPFAMGGIDTLDDVQQAERQLAAMTDPTRV